MEREEKKRLLRIAKSKLEPLEGKKFREETITEAELDDAKKAVDAILPFLCPLNAESLGKWYSSIKAYYDSRTHEARAETS